MKPEKAIAALIVGSPKGKKDEGEEESEYDMVAEEILAAVKDSDSSALAESLRSFVQLCKGDMDEDEEE